MTTVHRFDFGAGDPDGVRAAGTVADAATAGDRSSSARVAIVGGGAGGLAVAAALRRRLPAEDRIVVVEPSADHYYQPGFTLVGGGVWPLERTRANMADLIPQGVTWRFAAVARFDPDANRLELDDGGRIDYDYLVAAPGLRLEWERVPGLAEALGDERVGSIYAAAGAEHTARAIREFRGGRAVFTQPPMPIKCPGAPQKIVYMAADTWRRSGVLNRSDVRFNLAQPSLFSVPEYVPTLEGVAARYGVGVGYRTRLVAVDGPNARATFERDTTDGETERFEVDYDLLHAVPPQGPLKVVRESPLANEAGWIDVDANTLRHRRYPNVFGIGDALATPNSKTAAAVRAQLPVVVANLEAAMSAEAPQLAYSGYASCPLITAHGRVVLAEFTYGGQVAPSLSWDSTRERRSAWWLKRYLLPWMYWKRLLRGRDLPLVSRH